MPETLPIEESDALIGPRSSWFYSLEEPVPTAVETERREGDVEKVVADGSRDLTSRVTAQLSEDQEADSDVVPTPAARHTCERIMSRLAPHVAWAPGLKVAAFTEDNGGVSVILQSLVTDRRVNLRISPDGTRMCAVLTDEHMETRVRQDCENEPQLPRELAAWVTSRF